MQCLTKPLLYKTICKPIVVGGPGLRMVYFNIVRMRALFDPLNVPIHLYLKSFFRTFNQNLKALQSVQINALAI